MAEVSQPTSGPAGPGLPDVALTTAPAERLVTLDLIRGIAVLGILFANITMFGHPSLAYFWPDAFPGGGSVADRAVWLFQFLFIDGKMRGLFTLLFGASMMLFLDRVWARDGTSWLQFRRLAWLLIFGLLHYVLLFRGDILFAYAVWGLIALPLARLGPLQQLVLGLMLYALGSLLMIQMTGYAAFYEQVPAACAKADSPPCTSIAETLKRAETLIEREQEVYSGNSYANIVGYALQDQPGHLADATFFVGFETFPLILIGMALYGFGFFSGGFAPATLRKWGWAGVIAGTVLTLPMGLWALHTDFPYLLTLFLFNGAAQLPRLLVTLGLAALITVWTPTIAASAIGLRLVAAGRMALSNYLATSVVMVVIFQGWALGFFGTLSRTELLAAVLLGWILMLLWSKPWLNRFRFGPLEWLWRCLTYRQILPIRR